MRVATERWSDGDVTLKAATKIQEGNYGTPIQRCDNEEKARSRHFPTSKGHLKHRKNLHGVSYDPRGELRDTNSEMRQ